MQETQEMIVEEYRKAGRDFMQQMLKQMSVQERLEGIPPQARLEGVSPEELAKSLSPEYLEALLKHRSNQ